MKKKIVINCEKGTKKLYDEINRSRYFRYIKDLSTIFCLAAALGYKNNKYKELSSLHSGGLIRAETMERNTDVIRFIESLAIHHAKSLGILSDERRVYEIAEAYANGGIRILYSMIFDNYQEGDFDKKIESEILKIWQNKK